MSNPAAGITIYTKSDCERAYELGVKDTLLKVISEKRNIGRAKEASIVYMEEQFIRTAYNKGWYDCRKTILEILSKPIQNADLSWDECDSRYIDKIHEEI
jgi:hypothetical protein